MRKYRYLVAYLILFTVYSVGLPVQAEKIRYYHSDLNGSPVAISDEHGGVVWRGEYLPFGVEYSLGEFDESPGMGFIGREQIDEFGLNYFVDRFYDPEIRRFVSIDPVDVKYDHPVSFNRYAYAGNNPVKYTDPEGQYIELGVEFASMAMGVLSLTENIQAGKYWSATVDVGCLVVDGALMVVPLAPGVTGMSVRATREGTELLAKQSDGLVTAAGRGADEVTTSGSALANASSSAFKAADDVAAWIPKNKHLLDSTAKRAAKFNTNSFDDVQSIVAEALRSPNAKFMANNADGAFRVVTDLGREIGSKGQTSVRVIVGNDGKIWNAFPVNAQ